MIQVQNVVMGVYTGIAGFTVATNTTGTELNGTYTWKVAFVARDGEESGASNASSSLAVTNNRGTLSVIPTGDSRTTARNVYRKGGLLANYYFVGQIADNVSTTFLDSTTDLSALNAALILAGDIVGDQPNTRIGGAELAKYPCLHYDRIFWADQNTPNLLFWSKPLNGFAYPVNSSISVGDSKPITGLVSSGGELVIIKSDSIWRLTGSDESSFQLSRTLSSVGSPWPFTITVAGGGQAGFYFTSRIIFGNQMGIWAFNGYTSVKISPKLDLWFRQDDRTNISVFGTNGFHPPEITNSAVTALFDAKANAQFYYWAYAEAGQSNLNSLLRIDLERGTIEKRPFPARSLTVDQITGYFYAGSKTGIVVQLDDWNASTDGLGNAVNMDFQDGYRDLGMRGSWFALWGLEFVIQTNGQTVLPTVYYNDGETSEPLPQLNTIGLNKVFVKCVSGRSRQIRNYSLRLNAQTNLVNVSGKPSIQLQYVKPYFEPRGARARTGEKQ